MDHLPARVRVQMWLPSIPSLMLGIGASCLYQGHGHCTVPHPVVWGATTPAVLRLHCHSLEYSRGLPSQPRGLGEGWPPVASGKGLSMGREPEGRGLAASYTDAQ